MLATTATSFYSLLALRFNVNSEELTGIFESARVPLDLGFELTLENQPTAKMVFASCFPKHYEKFGRLYACMPIRGNEIAIPALVIKASDSGFFRQALTLQDLRNRGLYQDEFT